MIFTSANKLRHHRYNVECQFESLDRFVKKITPYHPNENVIKKMLLQNGMEYQDHYLDHFIVYDFESILEKISEKHGDSTEYTTRHKLVSVSICDSLTNEVKCLVHEDSKALLTNMFEYIHELQEKIHEYNFDKFKHFLIELMDKYGVNCEEQQDTPFFEYHKNFGTQINSQYKKVFEQISTVLLSVSIQDDMI